MFNLIKKIFKKREGWLVLCPFHNENTPSCVIKKNGDFECLGCNRSGNVFDSTNRFYIQQKTKDGHIFWDNYIHPECKPTKKTDIYPF